MDVSGKHVLLPVAKGARNILEKGLSELGAMVTRLDTYDTVFSAPDPSIDVYDNDIVFFTSSSIATAFFDHVYDGQSIISVCMGEATKNTVNSFVQEDIRLSNTPSLDGFLNAILL